MDVDAEEGVAGRTRWTRGDQFNKEEDMLLDDFAERVKKEVRGSLWWARPTKAWLWTHKGHTLLLLEVTTRRELADEARAEVESDATPGARQSRRCVTGGM